MKKYSFLDDYSEGCHPEILSTLAKTNLQQQKAYGHDEFSHDAKDLIRTSIGKGELPIYLVAGGTLANIIITSGALKSHEAMIAAASGHVTVRETGAIEATGHKIIAMPSQDGKLTLDDIEQALGENAQAPHMVKPRLVYVSNATELGTIYRKKELEAISDFCRKNSLLLMLDGARLGAALTAPKNDLSLKDIAELTDIFWIGGTKSGTLIGEAIVIPNIELAEAAGLKCSDGIVVNQFCQTEDPDIFAAACQWRAVNPHCS